MDGSLKVLGLGKRYRVVGTKGHRSLRDFARAGFRRTPAEHVWGLRDVSFEVEPGRTVGVVGRNGAGKSSLLRLIAGVGRPDEGRIEIRGRTGALLDIGAGLTDDLTGRENMMLAGLIAGMSRREVQARADRIIAFAELEEAIDAPLRTYSTGMKMRLAFSVAIHVSPDILLIDEVLAVGDATFQRKCLARINEIKAAGCTIFFVSHDASLVRALCDDVLYLRKGRVVAFGPTAEVMPIYDATSGTVPDATRGDGAPEQALDNGNVLKAGVNRFGTFEAEIRDVALRDAQGRPVLSLLSGSALAVEFDYWSGPSIGGVLASVTLRRPDGTACFDTNTELVGLGALTAGHGRVRVLIDRLDLAGGNYVVDVGLHDTDWSQTYDSHVNVYPLSILGRGTSNALLDPPVAWDLKREPLGLGRRGPLAG